MCPDFAQVGQDTRKSRVVTVLRRVYMASAHEAAMAFLATMESKPAAGSAQAPPPFAPPFALPFLPFFLASRSIISFHFSLSWGDAIVHLE